MSKPKVLALCGATASGKSALAMALAQELNGEIVCMDSMQLYRRMDIGTAKPTPEERAQVPHHMLDILEPTATYAVADYALGAEKIIRQILSRGKLPMLVGGTGLYLKALMHGMELGGAGSDEALRRELNRQALEIGGKERLHQRLTQADPETAARLHPNDIRRVIRAIEVYELTGKPLSQQNQAQGDGPFEVLPLAIDMPRERLYRRLEERVQGMMKAGLLDEVQALLESGVTAQCQSMQGIGYKELIPVVLENAPLEKAVWQIILHTRHYAKRQNTWLRAEPQTRWLNAEQDLQAQAMEHIRAFWKGRNDP